MFLLFLNATMPPILIKFQTFLKYTHQTGGLFPMFCTLLSVEVSMEYLNLCLKSHLEIFSFLALFPRYGRVRLDFDLAQVLHQIPSHFLRA